jgi:hypothetical protein
MGVAGDNGSDSSQEKPRDHANKPQALDELARRPEACRHCAVALLAGARCVLAHVPGEEDLGGLFEGGGAKGADGPNAPHCLVRRARHSGKGG